jgi:Mitochondrial inner-membrane-bound regulator
VVVSSRCSNFSSSAEGDNDSPNNNQQEDDREPIPDPNTPNNAQYHTHERQRWRRARPTLTVESLGRPGKIIVLPHTKRRKLKVIQPKTKGKLDDASTEEDALFLPVDDSAGTDKNAAASVSYAGLLDEIRSTHSPGDIISKKKWTELQTKIKEGFTQGQLSKYASLFSQSSLPPPQRERDLDTDNENENENEIWQAAESLLKLTFGNAGAASNEISKATKTGDKNEKGKLAKEILAERILRDCWKLETHNTVGRMDMTIPAQVMPLILSSHQSFDKLMSDSSDAKVEILESTGLIRLHGTRRACEQTRGIVRSYCSSVCSESIDLPFLKKLRADKDDNTRTKFIQWIGKTYDTFIQDQGRTSMASVSYLEGNENNFNKARRDLEIANFITAAKPAPFCSYVPSSTSGYMRFISHKRVAVMSQLDRQKSWTRWAIPSLSADFVRDSAPPLFSKHSPNLSSEILQVLKENASHSHQPDVEEKLTAEVGQCLFEKCTEDDITPLSASKLGELSVPRIWHGWLPKARPFVELLKKFPGEKKFGNSHRFRMIPCNQNGHNLPILEVEVHYPWTKNEPDRIPFNEAKLKSVKALVEETSVDYLLPECNHDIRFTRTFTRNILEAPENNVYDPLRMAILSPLETVINQPLEPFPLTCEVPLPKSLLRDVSVEETQNVSESSEAEAGCDTIVGKYYFPGVQNFLGTLFRPYDFMGEKLVYSHVSGGQLDAERDDHISLQMLVNRAAHSSLPPLPPNVQDDGSANTAESALEQEFRSFYRTSCQLAFSLSQYSRKRKY